MGKEIGWYHWIPRANGYRYRPVYFVTIWLPCGTRSAQFFCGFALLIHFLNQKLWGGVEKERIGSHCKESNEAYISWG